MSEVTPLDSKGLEDAYYRLYRDFFDLAEKKRRWSLRDDIPWDQCNRAMDPAIADVVESFCAVELYLPDYIGKILPRMRANRGRAWFYANWGYEESKHSLALGDWLLRSGSAPRSRWPTWRARSSPTSGTCRHDNPLGMVDVRHGAGAGHLAELPQPAPAGRRARRPGPVEAAESDRRGRAGPPRLLPPDHHDVPGAATGTGRWSSCGA